MPNAVWPKEVLGIGLEVSDIEHPSSIGNRDSELMFFIAFSQEREKPATVVGTAKSLQWARNCKQRWRLVIVAVRRRGTSNSVWEQSEPLRVAG